MRADELCLSLDRWKDWADGHDIDGGELFEIATALDGHQQLPSISQLRDTLGSWAGVSGIEIQRPDQSVTSIELGLDI